MGSRIRLLVIVVVMAASAANAANALVVAAVAQSGAAATGAAPPAAPATPPSPADKPFVTEAITLVKEITTSLLLLATGAFALIVEHFLPDKNLHGLVRTALILCYIAFAASLFFGLRVLMAVMFQLADGTFEPNAEKVRWNSGAQIVCAGIAGLIFVIMLSLRTATNK